MSEPSNRAAVSLTTSQLRQLASIGEDHPGGVLIEALPDAYARVLLIGADGEPIGERTLFPV
jgi:hypothetical protein